MSTELLSALVAYAFVTSITPGPNNLMLMASGTNFGFARTMPHMAGVAIGFTVMILLVGAGLAQVFEAVPGAHLGLKVASCVYLLWLAWKIATARPAAFNSVDARARPMTFLQAAAFQWINPKAWTMALTAVSAYVLPASPLTSLVVVALVFGAVNLPSVSSWALMGAQLRLLFNDPAKLRAFNILAALTLVATLWPILTAAH